MANLDGLNVIKSIDEILNDPDNCEVIEESPIVFWPNEKLDPRLGRLSYSSSLLLHGCPRKYQLQKMQSGYTKQQEEDWKQTLTFAYGHAIGTLVQDILVAQKSRDQVIFDMMAAWPCDLFDENEKQKKSFAHAMNAAAKFYAMQDDGFFEDYEVAIYNGKPAAELSFRIWFPNGSSYRGYVDLVVKNKYTGEYVIVEVKSNSGRKMAYSQYKNSAQAIGYSVVLDKIHPGLASYTVEYLVYMTYLERWENFSFPKTMKQRALWVRDRLWEVGVINELVRDEGTYGVWPMHGEHCFSYMRECEFMGICHQPTDTLTTPLREKHLVESGDNTGNPYEFEFNLIDLIGE